MSTAASRARTNVPVAGGTAAGFRRALGLLATVAVVVAWIVLLRPQSLGGPAAYIVVSGESMEPTLENGDLVITRQTDSYEIGDLIAYEIPEGDAGAGIVVIHRVIGGSAEEGFVTQGDNREEPDLWRPKPDDIAGKMWVSVPRGGLALTVLRSPLALAVFAGSLAFFVVFWGAWRTEPPESRRQQADAPGGKSSRRERDDEGRQAAARRAGEKPREGDPKKAQRSPLLPSTRAIALVAAAVGLSLAVVLMLRKRSR